MQIQSCYLFSKSAFLWKNNIYLWRGTGEREPGRIRARGRWEVGGGGTGCGVMRGREAGANYQKSEPKNIHYLL